MKFNQRIWDDMFEFFVEDTQSKIADDNYLINFTGKFNDNLVIKKLDILITCYWNHCKVPWLRYNKKGFKKLKQSIDPKMETSCFIIKRVHDEFVVWVIGN